MMRHLVLLLHGTVVLDAEDQRVLRVLERVRLDGVTDDVTEADLGGERVAVVDDGFAVLAVPAVHWRGETGSRGQSRSVGTVNLTHLAEVSKNQLKVRTDKSGRRKFVNA